MKAALYRATAKQIGALKPGMEVNLRVPSISPLGNYFLFFFT